MTTDPWPTDDDERVDGEPDWDRREHDLIKPDDPSGPDDPIGDWPVLPPHAAARYAEHLRRYPRR